MKKQKQVKTKTYITTDYSMNTLYGLELHIVNTKDKS
jgi:hypothetical protein